MDSSLKKNGLAHVAPVVIEEELKGSFLDYAMSVVVSRAIPDVRDGLKPVHRRILYTMHQLGFYHNKPYHKSVRVVGDVMGKFHPHGDQAIYQSMVGMAQDFNKRYPLLDGQGNWGSIDGDNAAAMRYTEVRMAKITQELLADIEKNTVGFTPNFDDSTVEPVVLPSKLPNLLMNGTAGIAVGMATSLPPHNLTELLNACIALMKNPNLTDDELFALVPGPDFPTSGIICGRAGIVRAYKTGRGSVIVRGVICEEETKKGISLVVTELPYQVNKAELAIKIAGLVKEKIIDGISNIKDESSMRGIRLVIELKRGEIPAVIINQLYKHTALQTSISFLMLALLDNRPLVFTLRQMLQEFLLHRKQVIFKRSVFDLDKVKAREHILAGFVTALQHIDEIVALIKQSESPEEAMNALYQRFLLSAAQSKAILEMRLQRLTGLEQEKIHQEMEFIKSEITRLASIVDNESVLKQVLLEELEESKKQYGDVRRTRIEGAIDLLTEADLIPDEEVVVTLTKKGYIKRVTLDTYGVQHRGGRGKMALASLETSDDWVEDLFVTKTHDTLLFFTNLGRIYSLNVFEIPEASRTARGRAVINLLPLQEGERVVKLLCTRDFDGKFLVMLTRKGIIKRTDAADFSKIRSTGIRAITLHEADELVFCSLSSGSDTVIIATANGLGIRFNETEVRAMGRQASGVIGIRLKENDYVVGMEVVGAHETADMLFATEYGYGKKVSLNDFRVAHRGGMGVRTIPTDKRNGEVVGLTIVSDTADVLLIDHAGKIIRLPASEVRTMGRQAKGVRLIRLDDDQKLASIAAIDDTSKHTNDSNDSHSDDGETHKSPRIRAESASGDEEYRMDGASSHADDMISENGESYEDQDDNDADYDDNNEDDDTLHMV